MSLQVISTKNIQKQVELKGNLEDLFLDVEEGKFNDYLFFYNGQQLQQVTKVTKLTSICQQGTGGTLEIKKKVSDPVQQDSNKIKQNSGSSVAKGQNVTQPPLSPFEPIPNQLQQEQSQINTTNQNQPNQVDDVWATVVQPNQNYNQQNNTTVNQIKTTTTTFGLGQAASINKFQTYSGQGQANQFGQSTGALFTNTSGNIPHKAHGNTPPNQPIIPSGTPTIQGNPFGPQKITPQLFGPPTQLGPAKVPSNQIPNKQYTRKQIVYRDQINDEQKIIHDFIIKITNKGNRVEFENEKLDIKAIFLEENANENIQAEIKQQLDPKQFPQDAKYVLKCVVGQDNTSTKAILKKNLDGLAIQWATGLITLFEFDLQI